MRDRCVAQAAARGLLSVKLKHFAIKEWTILKLADQTLSIPLSKGPETVMPTGRVEAKLSVHSSPESLERGNAGHPRSIQAPPRLSRRQPQAGIQFRREP